MKRAVACYVAAGAAAIALLLVGALEANAFAALNPAALLWLHAHAAPGLGDAAIAVTRTGSLEAVAAYGLAFIALRLALRARADAIGLGIALVGAAGTAGVLKASVHEPRPHLFPWIFPDTGYAFPSGHTTMSSTLAFFVVGWLLLQRWPVPLRLPGAVACVAWAAAVVGSRLVLGVHWPMDVVTSAFIGLAWASAGLAARERLITV